MWGTAPCPGSRGTTGRLQDLTTQVYRCTMGCSTHSTRDSRRFVPTVRSDALERPTTWSLCLLQSCGASVAGTWSFSTGSCQQSLRRRGCLESAFMMVGAARRSWVPEQTLSSSVYPVRVIGLSSRSVSLETLWVEA